VQFCAGTGCKPDRVARVAGNAGFEKENPGHPGSVLDIAGERCLRGDPIAGKPQLWRSPARKPTSAPSTSPIPIGPAPGNCAIAPTMPPPTPPSTPPAAAQIAVRIVSLMRSTLRPMVLA
jgi:hypothetical protein